MARFRSLRFLWLLILVASSLCVEAPPHEGDQTSSAQTRLESNAKLRSSFQNTDWDVKGQENTLRLRTDIVTLSVSVTDKQNNFVPNLSLQDFEVYEDGIKQNVTFFSDEDVPLNIGILLDASGSLKNYFNQSLEAAKEFIRTSHREDAFFFMTFSKKIKVQVEGIGWDTVDKYLHLSEPEGYTSLYDSVYFGLEKVKQGKHRKRALLIISDGQENSSRYKYGELMNLIKEANVQIYCVGIGDTSSDGNFSYGESLLNDLAGMTGAKSFFPRNANRIEDAVNRIALLLRHQYSIGYYPGNSRSDKGWRKLKVKLQPSWRAQSFRVSVKQGYYASP